MMGMRDQDAPMAARASARRTNSPFRLLGALLVGMLPILCWGAIAAPSALAAPANDDFAQAEELTGTSDTASGTNVDATGEPNEPENRPGIPPGATVWYRWTAPADLEVTVDTCDSDYDTVMAAYEGDALASLERLDSNDDGEACGSTGSEVEFDADAGITYWIAVDGWYDGSSYAQGSIELELTTVAIEPPPPPGPPEDFYVRTGGTGTDCTEAEPCGTIADALAAHRVTSGPGDVIDVGPGSFAENVGAGDEFDDGLTIRGTLASDGEHLTAVTGSGGGGASCPYACAVLLGASEDVEVTLRDIDVSTETADGYVGPIMVAGGSDLDGVDATAQSGAFTTAIVELLDEDPGTVITSSTIDARDTFAVGIWGGGGAMIRDSEVHGDYQAIQQFTCGCSAPRGHKIIRSWISTTDNSQPAMNLDADLTLDSSLVTGGSGIFFQAYHGDSWEINNSTIDAGEPGVADPGGVYSLSVGSYDGWPNVTVGVDSSILVEPIEAWGDGVGTVICAFSDLRVNAISSPWVDDCQPGSNDNITTDPVDLFAGGDPYDWRLKTGSPAIDSGRPGAIPAGFATRDLAGDPRLAAGLAGNCPDPIRDKGAYEAAGPPCSSSLPTLKNGVGPEVGTQLGSNPGKWTNRPSSFRSQFLRCDAAGDACEPIADYRSGGASYRAKPADTGHTLRTRYIATNGAGDSAAATSAASGVITQEVPTNASPPTIVGGESPVKGSGLNSTPGKWTSPPSTYLRQWLRCDELGESCAEITVYRPRTSYTPKGIDLGHTLRVRVIATNGAGDSEPATSEPSGVVSDSS